MESKDECYEGMEARNILEKKMYSGKRWGFRAIEIGWHREVE